MKTRLWLLYVAIAFAALLQGCALKTQNLHLDPQLQTAATKVADGALIGLAVRDAREDKKLGEVGDPNTKMVDVRLDENFAPLLYDRISKALTERGFKIVPYSDALTRSLQVEVRRLELSSVKQPFQFETELRAEVAAVARGENETFDRLFYVRTYKESAGPPYRKDSNALVNTAVSRAIDDMLSDDKLLEMLAR